MRVGGQVDFEGIAFAIDKTPMIDERRPLTIGGELSLKFEPALRQLDRKVMVGPEYHQPGGPLTERDLAHVDAVLKQS